MLIINLIKDSTVKYKVLYHISAHQTIEYCKALLLCKRNHSMVCYEVLLFLFQFL